MQSSLCAVASALLGLTVAGALCPLHAHTRHFTYLYEATTAAPGEVELENWVTWTGGSGENGRFNGFAFRHEVEFGLTDRFQLSLYVADWTYIEDPQNHQHGTRFQDAALEAIYRLSDPVDDPIGSALYGEVRGGDRFAELEAKFILEKDLGPWIFAYNATLEAEWEGEGLREKAGAFNQALGISRRFGRRFYAGAELVHEVGLPDWNRATRSLVYAGPNVGLRLGRWWATVTPLFQLTRIRSEPDYQARLIIGTEF
jgi:hypothetical protein